MASKRNGDMGQHEIVVPDASPVIQSLRSIGYSLETAIADIIDNSLDSGADLINIQMKWDDEKSYIRIEDNGSGMTEQELVTAMKLGSKNPLEKRDAKELGRFGMGLKTASFSLGERLTVVTKKAGKLHSRCWDLGVVQATNEWKLLKQPYSDSIPSLGELSGQTGTIVLIEKLDRIVRPPFNVKKQRKYFGQVHSLEKHLQMVFHRFLEGANRVYMTLNNNPLIPWDPFCSKLQYTHEMGSERQIINGNQISIEGFILPHHSKISKDQYNDAGGPLGWYDQQGFYIYRNKRLLTVSGWLSLFPKEEAAKLARIKVDIGQDADFDWQIDVKKSVARPPQETTDMLKRWAERARELSRRVYFHRGISKVHGSGVTTKRTEIDLLWTQTTRNNRSYFVIHKQNPMLEKIRNSVGEETIQLLDSYLHLLQEFCPVNTLAYSPQLEKVAESIINEEDKEPIKKLTKVYRDLELPLKVIISVIKGMPSYSKYDEQAIKSLIGEEIK